MSTFLKDPDCPACDLNLINRHHREWADHFRRHREAWQALKRLHGEQRAQLEQTTFTPLERSALIVAQTRDIIDWQRTTTASRVAIQRRHRQELGHFDA